MALTPEMQARLKWVKAQSAEKKQELIDLVIAHELRVRPSLFRAAGLLDERPVAPAVQPAVDSTARAAAAPVQRPEPKPEPAPTQPEQKASGLDPATPLEETGLEAHVVELLKAAGLKTVGDVAAYRAEHGNLTPVRGIGKATDAEIVKRLGL